MADDLTYPADAMRQANAEARRWKARHDDLAAALTTVPHVEPCRFPDDACPCVVPLFDVRALVADPAAVLADRDRRIKAEAWGEGYDAGHLEATSDVLARNPYREGERADD